MPTPEPKLVTRSFVLLVIGHFLQALGYASLILLPLYLKHLGASRALIGTIMGVAAVGGIAARPLIGWALDVWGRKPTLIAGTLCLSLSLASVMLVTDLGPMVYAHRILFGLGAGALFSGYFTWVTDFIPTSRRTEGIALFGISGIVPMVINPFAESLGIGATDLPRFYLVIAAVIFSSVFALLPMREPRRTVEAGAVSMGAMRRAFAQRTLRPVWFAVFFAAGLTAAVMSFATVAAEARGIDRPALLWLTYAGGAALIRVFGGRLPDRVGTSNMVAPSVALNVLACLGLAAAQTPWAFLVCGFVAGSAHGFGFPVLASQVVDRAPPALKGSCLAMLTGLWEASVLALPPLVGIVADAFDDASGFAFAALAGIVGIAGWLWLERKVAEG